MGYISKENIIAAYSQLSKLTNDPSAQGATQVTSFLRYLFALAHFYVDFNRPCDTKSKDDKEKFVEYVGEVVAINDRYYTANFFNSLKEDADYKVGSNFFSVNVVKTSLENRGKDYVFPKRGNSPLFLVRNGELILKEEYFNNIGSVLYNTELSSAFAIWLTRNDAVNQSDVYDSIKQILSNRYSAKLVAKFLPERNRFISFGSWKFMDSPAQLELSDFPKPTNKQPIPTEAILSSEELIQKVRDSFLRYWQIIDQHGAQFELYINKFESVINPILDKLELGISDVFAIVDFEQYNSIINHIISIEPSLSYLDDEKGPDGTRYYIWSTNRHFRNYLEILSLSDFFGNVRQQHNRALSIASATTDFNKDYLRAMRTKPFLLLAGISGTGKSRIVKQFAYKSCPDNAVLRKDTTSPGNYCLIEVKPNWHDSTELLGYRSQIGSKHYVLTPFVKFLVKAMLHSDTPFFVCLDEMNLAPVEQYFAEFLSVLESRKKKDGHITSEALIKADVFKEFEHQLRNELFGLESSTSDEYGTHATSDPTPHYGKENEVYETLKTEGLRIPENLIVIGTVNMDETTHQFSRKVIDRAMTIEMNIADGEAPFKSFFDDYEELTYVNNPLGKGLFLPKFVSADEALMEMGEEYRQFLKDELPAKLAALNRTLNGTPFKIAYRVQNELILYFAALRADSPDVEKEKLLASAIDSILMMKVLPRIEGDVDLLKEPLKALADYTADYPQSRGKVKEMTDRLDRGQFTSFWP